MADDDLVLDDIDENEDNDFESQVNERVQINKLDARKRLEEYLEEKKLRELIDY